ncbi:MAG: glycosyltransferase [Pseudomonadota bacterium]
MFAREPVTKTTNHEVKTQDDRDLGNVSVQLFPVGCLGARHLSREILTSQHDLVLLNSFFDGDFTLPFLWMHKFGRVPNGPVILSPRGEFSKGALAIKANRKQSYIWLVRKLGLLKDIWLHATGEHERKDIEALGLDCRGILVAENCRALSPPSDIDLRQSSTPLRIIFLSRIDNKKNLAFAISCLQQVKVPVEFDIYGPISNQPYADKCRTMTAALPKNVQVKWAGTLAHDDVPATLADYDLFFFPTLGENFGHAINDAFMSGLPVLISDQTPWRNLQEAKAGWDLPLGSEDPFVDVIHKFSALPPEARLELRHGARRLAEKAYKESGAIEAHKDMFNRVINEDR